MDEEYDEDEFEAVSRRFMPTDLLVLGLDLARGISQAFTSTLGTTQALVASHANFKVDQAAFHEEAAIEIESFVSGEQED